MFRQALLVANYHCNVFWGVIVSLYKAGQCKGKWWIQNQFPSLWLVNHRQNLFLWAESDFPPSLVSAWVKLCQHLNNSMDLKNLFVRIAEHSKMYVIIPNDAVTAQCKDCRFRCTRWNSRIACDHHYSVEI